MTRFWPAVQQAVPGEGFVVYGYCNDGTVRRYDVKHLLKTRTVLESLLDERVFREALTLINDTVAWNLSGTREGGCGIDLDPFTVFEQPRVPDPLANTASLAISAPASPQ